jgi:hypothetical protein
VIVLTKKLFNSENMWPWIYHFHSRMEHRCSHLLRIQSICGLTNLTVSAFGEIFQRQRRSEHTSEQPQASGIENELGDLYLHTSVHPHDVGLTWTGRVGYTWWCDVHFLPLRADQWHRSRCERWCLGRVGSWQVEFRWQSQLWVGTTGTSCTVSRVWAVTCYGWYNMP